QSYLWYGRDGVQLDHDIHLFAFISNDFDRFASDNFRGYAKPVLGLHDGRLVTENVPVPRHHYYLPWLTEKLKDLDELFLARALRYGLRKLQLRKPAGSHPKKIGPIVAEVFRELHKLNRQKNSTLVLVYLPMRIELYGKELNAWQKFIHSEAARQ